jgi:hypothetical protein
MRALLLAAFVAAAPLAWCETARAHVLAQTSISLSGWRAGEPGTGVEIPVGFDADQNGTEDSLLFEGMIWTPADVGRVVSIGASDDPDFAAASATLANGLSSLVSLRAFVAPGGGGPGMESTETNLFVDTLLGAADFYGATVDAIALRLDALALNDPIDGSVDLQVTLLVMGSAESIPDSAELAECRNELERTRWAESQCWEVNAELWDSLAGTGERLLACESELGSSQLEVSRLEAELVQAESAANDAQAQLALAQAELALAQAQLANAQAQLASAEGQLAAALADADADGVRDPGDSCLGSEPGAAVDGVGCSVAQFCSAIDASTGSGRAICNHADWLNDEPLSDSPNDCKAYGALCEPR